MPGYQRSDEHPQKVQWQQGRWSCKFADNQPKDVRSAQDSCYPISFTEKDQPKVWSAIDTVSRMTAFPLSRAVYFLGGAANSVMQRTFGWGEMTSGRDIFHVLPCCTCASSMWMTMGGTVATMAQLTHRCNSKFKRSNGQRRSTKGRAEAQGCSIMGEQSCDCWATSN